MEAKLSNGSTNYRRAIDFGQAPARAYQSTVGDLQQRLALDPDPSMDQTDLLGFFDIRMSLGFEAWGCLAQEKCLAG